MTDVVRQYQPDAAAVENTFVNKDGVGTLKLGQARAIALLVPAQAGIKVAEYAPNKVKKTIVGVGHADNALAIALCHAHYARSSGAWEAALAKAL